MNMDYPMYIDNDKKTMECGSPAVATGYFCSFMIIVSFIFLNLFIAIILESKQASQAEDEL